MRSRLENPSPGAEQPLQKDTFPLTTAEVRSSNAAEPVFWERVGEVTRKYTVKKCEGLGALGKPRNTERLTFTEFGSDRGPLEVLTFLFRSYCLPDGYPDSVAPSYTDYMRWRAVQYFFGGAMSVFTTRSLLHSLGVARGPKAASGAIAVNWVIKDGAGRLGKMLFARQGKKFDADLKQMRLASSMLMGLGAGLELSTVAAPQLFLPLACAANVLKNIGAVTNTSTRAPIYKAFARKENLGDITAKGESISNMADLLGTGFGILLARNTSLHAAFFTLSLGYVIASYNEIRSVQLPTLNRSRFAVAAKKFLETGAVPSVPAVSRLEKIIAPPWATERPVEMGAKVADAFEDLEDFREASKVCEGERYIVNFRPSQRRAYVVLREDAGAKDVLKGAFQAQLLLHHLKGKRLGDTEDDSASSVGFMETPVAPFAQGLRDKGCDLAPFAQGLRDKGCDLALQRNYLYGDEVDEWVSAAAEAPLATLRYNWRTGWLRRNALERARQHALTPGDVRLALAASKTCSDGLFEDFVAKASAEGWVMAESLLNPGDARLLSKRS